MELFSAAFLILVFDKWTGGSDMQTICVGAMRSLPCVAVKDVFEDSVCRFRVNSCTYGQMPSVSVARKNEDGRRTFDDPRVFTDLLYPFATSRTTQLQNFSAIRPLTMWASNCWKGPWAFLPPSFSR